MKKAASSTFKYMLVIISFVVALFPFYWLIITSLKSPMEISSMPITYFPKEIVTYNFTNAFSGAKFHIYIKNSLIVTLVSCVFIVLSSIMGGYALARYEFRLKKPIMLIMLVSQMVPLITAIIPLFKLYGNWKLLDTLWALIFSYTVGNIPFCLITMTSFFKRIPQTLEEAAMIDGCTKLGAATRVIVPTTLPGIMAVFVFAFTGCWNEMFYSIMFINSEAKRTIPVGLMNYVQKTNVNWGEMSAAAVVTLIPAIMLFFLVQKHIVSGLTAGAVKE